MAHEDRRHLLVADEVEPDSILSPVPETELISYPVIKKPIYGGILILLGAALIGVGAIILLYFPPLVEFFVKQKVVLEEGNQVYSMWKEPPMPIYTKFYLFNVTNPINVTKHGVKPILQEVGPFTYREHWLKVNISFYDNGTVSYRQRRDIEFVPDMSSHSDTVLITSINVPMVSAATLFADTNMIMKLAISAIFGMLKEELFTVKSVRQLLYEGYNDPLTKLAKEIMGIYPFDKFSYVMMQNGTEPEVFNVFTGKQDYSKFNVIDRWNGLSHIKFWDDKSSSNLTGCSMLNGTDGSGFPALRDPPSPLYVFVGDLCRSVGLDYNGTVISSLGVTALRYAGTERVFDNGTKYPENACFNPDHVPLPSGVMNASLCLFGSPIFISYPHFYLGDPSLVDAVVGLTPNKSSHEIYAEIDPLTSAPFEFKSRAQINIGVRNIQGIGTFDNVSNFILPTVWFSQEGQLPREYLDLLLSVTQLPLTCSRIFSYVLFAVGVLGCLIGLLVVILRIRHWRAARGLEETECAKL